ncbi:MAG: GNAT family N-acetyltransferase [Candidatus Micrarchaeota archaeon]|mgnify:CR=1 FL=1
MVFVAKVKFTIRKAKLSEIGSLSAMAQALCNTNKKIAEYLVFRTELLELVPNFQELWEKWIKKQINSNKGLVLVAEINEEIVAYCLAYIKENVKIYSVKKLGHIGDLFVKPKYRGLGITSEFKDKVFIWFKKKGIKYSSICVHAGNKKAHKIYKKWGFLDAHIEMRQKI